MAWIQIANTDWEYDNAATASDTYPDTHGTIAAGIRSYITETGTTRETYVKCRKISNNSFVATGELDKTYYDNYTPSGVGSY